MARVPAVLALAVVLAGCGGSSPSEPAGGAVRLTSQFRLIGSAAATEPDGSTVDCRMDLSFDLSGSEPRSIPGGLEYRGVHGGSLARTVLDAAGNGQSFWPDVHGAVVVRSLAPDRLEIEIPVNATTESRFWRELARFDGTIRSPADAAGSWVCAPLDIDEGGWVDVRYSARGTWRLEPAA